MICINRSSGVNDLLMHIKTYTAYNAQRPRRRRLWILDPRFLWTAVHASAHRLWIAFIVILVKEPEGMHEGASCLTHEGPYR